MDALLCVFNWKQYNKVTEKSFQAYHCNISIVMSTKKLVEIKETQRDKWINVYEPFEHFRS